jgi:general stress protein YciG
MTNSNEVPHSTARVRRGFAAMDPERQREIASAGGRAAHEKGSAHQFTAREARLAGLKSRALAAASAALASEAPQRLPDAASPGGSDAAPSPINRVL